MVTEEELEAFFAHHGVKGQRWGVRKANGKRTAKQKIGIVAAGFGSYQVGAAVITLSGGPLALAAIGGAAATIAGVQFTRALLDRHGDRAMLEIEDAPRLDVNLG